MGGRASSKRKRRGDKISSKKKSRKKESKKRRRRSYDSVSSSSEDDSLYLERRSSTSKSDHRRRLTKNNKYCRDSPLADYDSVNSDSDSSTTHDKDYKVRKARRSQVGSEDIKRKGLKRSISSIGDVGATSGRKRKRLGKDHVIRPIKKSSKKKSKKVLSSSSDSDSKSCSASQCRSSSSSSSGDDKRQKNKAVPDKEKERLRKRGSFKGKQKHKDRSPSCTSIGRGGGDPFFKGGDSDGNRDGELFPVDNSRRLRSVITVADQPRYEEENRWDKDPYKEEIVYDQNDYPSPRSLSTEGGSRMKSGNQSNVPLSDRIGIENIAGEEVYELEKSRIDNGDHQSEGGGCINNSKKKEIGMSVSVAALGEDVLESILRQKALENLRKFREMPQSCPRSNMVKINNETNLATLSDRTVDIVENNSIEQSISDAQEMNQRGGISLRREIVELVKLPDSERYENKPQMANLIVTPSCNGSALLECSEEDKSSCSPAVEAKAVSGNDTSSGAEVTKACSASNVELTSSVEPTHGEHSLGQRNDSSLFEQKTMSVMRGGELVQVNYKVYIPKKAPALGRRQLKR